MTDKCCVVPLMTLEEADGDFPKTLFEYNKIILLYVIDQQSTDVPAGLMGGGIKKAEKIMDALKSRLTHGRVKDYVEWGKWDEKVYNYSKMESADDIVLKKSAHTTRFSKKLEEKGLKVRLV